MNSLDLPQILYQPFAATGDKNTILNSPSTNDPQRANLQTGFPVITQIPIANGGIPPERMDFNGLGYLLSSFYFFTQCGGVYTFNQDVSNAIGGYPLGAVLHYTNSDNVSFNVRSLLENNTYNFVENPEYIDNEHWAYDSNIPKKNIGEIITSSIPLTDAGLHLLDGALIQGGGIYDDFVQYIAGLVNTYPQCFCSEAEWQQSVNTYLSCGKFVYNSTNNTVRLPKITGFIEGTIDSNALGDLVEAGLPNITGTNTKTTANWEDVSGCFTNIGTGNTCSIAGSTSGHFWGEYNFDASRSSSIYGNSNTVQPQSIKVFYYIVVANSTKTNIEVDIDEIVTDLNSKANNADVVHKTGYETITGIKTFSGNGWVTYYRNTNVTYDVAPSSVVNTAIVFTDKNGREMGFLENRKEVDNAISMLLNVKGVDGSYPRIPLVIRRYADGTTAAFAPSSDASNSIVTTVNKSKAENGYFKLGNGLIIQWGKTPNIGNAGTTCTLPTPFTTTNYSVTAITSSAFNENCIALTGKTTTNFTLVERGLNGGAHNVPNYFLAIGY